MEIRPSNHLTNLIGQIDYFSGYWSGSVKGTDEQKALEAITSGSSAILTLDDSISTEKNLFKELINLHFPEQLTKEKELVSLYTSLLGIQPEKSLTRKQYLRSEPSKLTAPSFSNTEETEQIFTSVSPFLIGQRLTELLQWYNSNMKSGAVHPLLIIGTMHLCLLHIYPFTKGSHAISLLALWRNIASAGYSFSRYSHIAAVLAEDPEGYFSALRQSEKTAYSSWSSLNIWLEYFLSSLLLMQKRLSKQQQQSISLGRLTEVQTKILELVSTKGAVSRVVLANHTGINENTIKYNLGVLTKRGYLTRLGNGRTTSYSLTGISN